MPEAAALRSIEQRDHAALGAVLEAMDPEESAEAAGALADEPEETVFSVAVDPATDGVFGFLALAPAEGTESSAWLAWSAFLPETPAEGASAALRAQVEEARLAGVTRLFVAEGDRPGDGASRPRLRAFAQAGFREAARVPGFYEPGEDAVFLEAVLAQEKALAERRDDRSIAVEGVHEHEETDDSWVLSWSPVRGSGSGPAALDKAAAKARKRGARMLVAAGPSNLPALDALLLEGGFRRTGRLSDYHAPGVHEVHYLLSFH